jgi:hypothetical protein
VLFIAITAVWMAIAGPLIDRKLNPRVEASALVRVQFLLPVPAKSPTGETPEMEGIAQSYIDYLRSPRAVQDVRRLAPGSPATVQDRLQRIRIVVIPKTWLLRCSLVVGEPARDASILNAATTAMLKNQPLPSGRQVKILDRARPPSFPSIRTRISSLVVPSLVILFLSLVSFVILRLVGNLVLQRLRPDRVLS